ncbi:MAG: hypothetical protein GMKNLPBB_00630 [Myxococcota bacterium]|nr:hypothetical protein [Myxococcota bacterium]
MPADERNVVAMSPFRQVLKRPAARALLDAMIERPDAVELVAGHPPVDLFYAIKETGLADALDILPLTTPEQMRLFTDLDGWPGGELDRSRIMEWIDAYSLCGREKARELIHALDPELVIWLLQKSFRIYNLKEEEDPVVSDQHQLIETPDRNYLLEVIDTEDDKPSRLLSHLLDVLYEQEPAEAWRLLEGSRNETAAILEEDCLRFRTARLEDLGFVARNEALHIYARANPEDLKNHARNTPHPAEDTGDPGPMPSPLARSLKTGGFLENALMLVRGPAQFSRIAGAMTLAANMTLSADGADPGDLEAVGQSLERMRSLLSLGLEFISDGDPETAAELLQRQPVSLFVRCGYNLLGQLRERLRKLVHGEAAPLPGRFLGAEDGQFVSCLNRFHPVFPGMLETPPNQGERLFASLRDADRVRERIEELEAAARILGEDILAAAAAPDELHLAQLFVTRLARDTGGKAGPGPIRAESARAFLLGAFEGAGEQRTFAATVLGDSLAALYSTPLDGGAEEAGQRIIARWMRWLHEQASAISNAGDPDLRILSALFWLAPPDPIPFPGRG